MIAAITYCATAQRLELTDLLALRDVGEFADQVRIPPLEAASSLP
jgi:hypothetical protein